MAESKAKRQQAEQAQRDHDAHLELEHVKHQRDEMLAALDGLLAIVSDSRGVAGYHLNGDVAEWDEFEEVDAAHAAIAKAKAAQAGEGI